MWWVGGWSCPRVVCDGVVDVVGRRDGKDEEVERGGEGEEGRG